MHRFSYDRHSRAGGNPDLCISEIFKDYCKSKLLDSRLRGNDGGWFGLHTHWFDLIRKRTYKGRLKTDIAESAKLFSDDLFFKKPNQIKLPVNPTLSLLRRRGGTSRTVPSSLPVSSSFVRRGTRVRGGAS